MNTRPILRLALAAAAFGVTGRVSAQNSPAKDSPFMPAGTAEIASDVGETLEFAGVSVIGKKTLVNLYDKQLKKNRWISVGDTVDGLNVLTYDARRDQVVVKVGGEQKLLTLRKSTGVVIHELLARHAEATPAQRDSAQLTAEAFALYRERQFAAAQALYTRLATATPDDHAAEVLRRRCHAFAAQPPAADWDGIYRLEVK